MKLSDYAKQQGVRYETAWRWFQDGKIKGHRVGAHTIMIDEGLERTPSPVQKVAVYARVSSAENKPNLDTQAERLVNYCLAKGYQVAKVVKEVGSGMNDARPKFLALLEDTSVTIIVVEHKDRASRFGVTYIDSLLRVQGRSLEVANLSDSGTEDLLADLTSVIYTFCVRLYGQRRATHKTETIVKQLQAKDEESHPYSDLQRASAPLGIPSETSLSRLRFASSDGEEVAHAQEIGDESCN